MKKGEKLNASVTIFLSMSLSAFIIIITLLIRLCIINAEKERFELASDISLNSVLGEYEKNLYERYGLIYIDASYLTREPSIENVSERLRFYLSKNTEEVLLKNKSPWGRLNIGSISINGYRTAAYEGGSSMRSQAVKYVKDSPSMAGLYSEVCEALVNVGGLNSVEGLDPLVEWGALMGAIEDMEKPEIEDEEGNLYEIPVSNPADWVYGLSGSDVIYGAGINMAGISGAAISMDALISKRNPVNEGVLGFGMVGGNIERENDTYVTYLIDKFGCRGNENSESLLKCELEYLIAAKGSDYENLNEVINRIFLIRFVDNLSLAMGDGTLREGAASAASMLEICTYDAAFIEPIATSIIFACAYLESLSDLNSLLNGGRVSFHKSTHNMNVNDVLNGTKYVRGGSEGLTYRQYLICLMGAMDEATLNYRTMDIMEIEIRKMSANPAFKMDWCIERLNAEIVCSGTGIGKYEVLRTYGYY